MPTTIPENSVGLVTPQTLKFNQPLPLDCGRVLSEYELIFETYGQLNQDASNAILVCHALSGDHHAAGYHSMEDKKPGWWNNYIGPGKPIDTNNFFIVVPNNLGSCKGSTGPNKINPETGKEYGSDFPIVTVQDWVNSQAQLADKLGISCWAAVIGGSLGGMQVIQWSISYPHRIKHAVVIAAAPRLSAQNIAFNEVARQAILSDPDFHQGHFYQHNTIPRKGLFLARMLGHITYLSEDVMRSKFDRDLKQDQLNFGFNIEFQIESYLHYQGKRFADSFDANSYLLMTKALDYFDPAKEYENDLAKAFSRVQAKFLVLSFTSDWRFAPERSREIVKALVQAKQIVSYSEIESTQGHDAFLIPNNTYTEIFSAYMQKVFKEIQDVAS